MMRVVGRDGDAILIADGSVGAVLLPDGRYMVAPLGSIVAQGDWQEAEGPVSEPLPAGLLDDVALLVRRAT